MTYQEAIQLKGNSGYLYFYQVSKKSPKLPVRDKNGDVTGWNKQQVLFIRHGSITEVEKMNLEFVCESGHIFIVPLKYVERFADTNEVAE